MRISESELILNPDGSIYHLHLQPHQIANTVITVGDPDRVAQVSAHFDTVEHRVNKREFVTHTGTLRGKNLTVISTGIGTDNIDIVLNELDALVNIDFNSRTLKKKLTSLDIIRIGTSGSMQPDLDIDSFIVSETAIGFDNLLYFYAYDQILEPAITEALMQHTNWPKQLAHPYAINANQGLLDLFINSGFVPGWTVTNVGFYGPQGRILRLPLAQQSLMERMASFSFGDKRISNLEMETAGIYAMSSLLGHRAISLNVLLANRALNTFSEDPSGAIDKLIITTLDTLCP